MTTLTLRQRQSLFSRDICRLLVYASGKGYEYTFGEAERPIDMQRIHFAAGRSKTMNSLHIQRCAMDLHFFKDGKLLYPEELGRYWEELDTKNSAGMFWKSFKDSPHFERRV